MSTAPDVSLARPDDASARVISGDGVRRDIQGLRVLAVAAADRTGLASVTSVEDLMCDPDLCHAVVGGLVAYFDHGHLTATFARTLAPEVTGAVRDRLAG